LGLLEGNVMIHEWCTVTVYEGRQKSYLEFLENIALPVRGDAFGICRGVWTCEFGSLNQVWHLWEYGGLAERAQLRAVLAKHARWKSEVLPEAARLILREGTRLMKPVKSLQAPKSRDGFYELRIYRTGFAKASSWAGAFCDIMPIREKYSQNVGIWAGEIPADEVMHMWSYPDLAARTAARTPLFEDPEWSAFLARNAGVVKEMQNILLLSTPFSPLR
jgi:hypothetical protein